MKWELVWTCMTYSYGGSWWRCLSRGRDRTHRPIDPADPQGCNPSTLSPCNTHTHTHPIILTHNNTAPHHALLRFKRHHARFQNQTEWWNIIPKKQETFTFSAWEWLISPSLSSQVHLLNQDSTSSSGCLKGRNPLFLLLLSSSFQHISIQGLEEKYRIKI